MPLGNNQDCIKFMQRAEQLVILEKGGYTLTSTNITSNAEITDIIQDDLKGYVLPLTGYTPNTPDATVEETPFGRGIITSQAAPRMTAYADLNPCDYRNLLKTLDGGLYDVLFLDNAGNIMYWQSGTSVYGFSANIWAITAGIPNPDALHEFYRLEFFFTSLPQFKEFRITKPSYNPLTELLLAMPNGLGINLNSYDGSDAIVYVADRCGAKKSGLLLADFELVETNSTATITAVTETGTSGVYTVEISLTAGQYALIRVKKLSGTNVTDVSWNVQLNG